MMMEDVGLLGDGGLALAGGRGGGLVRQLRVQDAQEDEGVVWMVMAMIMVRWSDDGYLG